jgi:NADH dehydrogenase (ubiquinone) 1 alpha subcomplex subunit 9
MQSGLKSLSFESLSYFGKRGYQAQRLHIYDKGGRNSISGIRATVFGATGFLGPFIGASMGYIGSDLIFPHCHTYSFDDHVKELKLCGTSGQAFIVRAMDFDDPKMIDRVIMNSNVVVNLVGPRKTIKHRKDFEYANVEIPRRIAEACKRNPGVIRLMHFSAVGAAKDSPSMDLSTKFSGEEAVLSEFPNATILRPSTIFGLNDYFTRIITTQRDYFYNFNVVYNDCTAKRQPIYVNDVANAFLNALKLHETCGQTYELGGPHVYSMKEIYEIMFNFIQRPPKLAYVPFNFATKAAQYIKNWEYFNLDDIIKSELDLVVSPKAKTIADLYVQPVSFPQGVAKFYDENKASYLKTKDELER